jgi:hypothetical protein
MSILTRAKKVKLDGENWTLIKLNPSHEELSSVPKNNWVYTQLLPLHDREKWHDI